MGLVHDSPLRRRSELVSASAEVDFIGGPVVERLMPALAIVEVEVHGQPLSCLAAVPIGMQVDVLVFHRAPQPFDEHIVDPATLAVHADRGVRDRGSRG